MTKKCTISTQEKMKKIKFVENAKIEATNVRSGVVTILTVISKHGKSVVEFEGPNGAQMFGNKWDPATNTINFAGSDHKLTLKDKPERTRKGTFKDDGRLAAHLNAITGMADDSTKRFLVAGFVDKSGKHWDVSIKLAKTKDSSKAE
jgi:hypothetical protein